MLIDNHDSSSTSLNIEDMVKRALDGRSVAYLEDVVYHGIHNMTNDYHGNSDDEYEAFAGEFHAQAEALLAQLELDEVKQWRYESDGCGDN